MLVDDSRAVRAMLKKILNEHPMIEVVAEAPDPYEAKDKIKTLHPDVLVLDIEMPRMDGLTFLKIIMERRPMPVIILSSISTKGSKVSLTALELGAFDVIAKPENSESVGTAGLKVVEAVLHAGRSDFEKRHTIRQQTQMVEAPYHAVPLAPNEQHILLIGASTGGTEAIKEVLTHMPTNIPGTCIVQHIPANFSKSFAERLNDLCPFTVKEAENGDMVEKNKVLIAPGGYHMMLRDGVNGLHVELNQGPKIHHQRPAVDILFQSAANLERHHKVAVLLTGMGKDGAEGMLSLKEKGVYTIAQHEDSCVVYGMPKAAVKLNAVYEICHLQNIPNQIFYGFSKKFFHFSPIYEE